MSTRDETEMALDGFHAAIVDVCKSQWADNTKKFARVDDARARLLALLAPEPEPSDAEIEAASKALNELQGVMSRNLWRAVPRWDEVAKPVLAAARAARQTGGA